MNNTLLEQDAEEPSNFGRLTRFCMWNLFGHRRVEFVPLSPGPTLLTGANGSGKSTILRSINAVGSGQWLDLLAVPFSVLELEFEAGDAIRVSPALEEAGLEIEQAGRDWVLDPRSLAIPDRDELLSSEEVRRLPDGRWEYEGRSYVQGHLSQILAIRDLALAEDAAWVAVIPRRFPVLYVPDQRLEARRVPMRRLGIPSRAIGPAAGTADQYARDLRRLIADGLSRYAAHSQTLDREFPEKVVNAMATKANIDLTSLNELLERVTREREDLESAGLLEREDHPVQFDSERLADENVAPVIKVYAEQTLEKFAALGELKTKLKAFSEFLNSHYRGKFVLVSPKTGFLIAVIETDERGEPDVGDLLRPSDLSSGEQQMLVLAYEVVFRTDPKTLILIDEPELSLHVLWQSTLIDDLARMGEIGELSFILATHSPTLIGDREELRFSLESDDPSNGAVDHG